ncbi:MAG: hypothetical protein CMC27_01300 [Flavobacteriaceae bacterium]|nr:hypothetical protein [Flavobacteriaceae bacterium]|tara:strand:+ start:1588 stop:1869 length:282 start_codon:yes stop_codon:yes gene_type:complete
MGRPHMGNSRVTVHQDIKQNWANGEATGFKDIKASAWINCGKEGPNEEEQEMINMFTKWLKTNSYTVGVQIQEKAGDNFIKLLSVNLFGNTEE